MRTLPAVLILSSVVAMAAPALADTTTVYPGTMCQGSVVKTVSHLEFDEFGTPTVVFDYQYLLPPTPAVTGAVFNDSTDTDMVVVCPVPHRGMRTDGKGWSSLVVTAANFHSTKDLKCDARTYESIDYGFGTLQTQTWIHGTDWSDRSFSPQPITSTGYTIITCTVPVQAGGRSGVASYRITE